MRQLIYYVATTIDGFIAGEGGSIDGFVWDEDYGRDLLSMFPETFPVHLRGEVGTREDNEQFDAVIMGRKTYEVGLQEGITSPYPTLDQYVVSRTMRASPDAAVQLISDDPVSVVTALKQEAGKAIWLCGGGKLATTLLDHDLIDGLIVKLNPVLFGGGIPLFSGAVGSTKLRLTSSKIYESGHAVLWYALQSNDTDI